MASSSVILKFTGISKKQGRIELSYNMTFYYFSQLTSAIMATPSTTHRAERQTHHQIIIALHLS
jgi:hypothetical protein